MSNVYVQTITATNALIGEVSTPAGSSFTPTNIPGITIYAWYNTNGYTDGVLLNHAGDASLNLTNQISNWPTLQEDGLYFTGSSRLRCENFTAAQPFEVFFVLSITNIGTWETIFDDIGGGCYLSRYGGNPGFDLAAPDDRHFPGSWQEGEKMVVNATFQSPNASLRTNNVSAGSNVTPGANGITGLIMGSDSTGTYGWRGVISEMVWITGTNLDTYTDARTLIYTYLYTNNIGPSAP